MYFAMFSSLCIGSWSHFKNEGAFCNPQWENVFRFVTERVKRDGVQHESSVVNELQWFQANAVVS